MSEAKECCAFCRFSLKWQGPMERQADYRESDGATVCRRHAPVKPPGEKYGSVHVEASWPMVSNLDWCGDFERTPEMRYDPLQIERGQHAVTQAQKIGWKDAYERADQALRHVRAALVWTETDAVEAIREILDEYDGVAGGAEDE